MEYIYSRNVAVIYESTEQTDSTGGSGWITAACTPVAWRRSPTYTHGINDPPSYPALGIVPGTYVNIVV